MPVARVPTSSKQPPPILLDRGSSLHASQFPTLSPFPKATGGSASDRAFLPNVLFGGTLSNRLSAFTLMHTFAQHPSVIGLEELDGKGERWCQYVNRTVAAGREESLKAARQLWTGWRRRPESKA